MNELREANNEEVVGEIDHDVDDALDLEELFTYALLEHQIEVDVTTIVGDDSERPPQHTPIDLTPPPVKTQLGEPEFQTVNNTGQWSEFTFLPVFSKGFNIYKRYALPTGVMPLP